MSEKLPRLPVESKESTERSPRYRTVKREVLETHEDGSKTECVIECNGRNHRQCIDIVSYDEQGQVIFAEQQSREELAPCDGKH